MKNILWVLSLIPFYLQAQDDITTIKLRMRTDFLNDTYDSAAIFENSQKPDGSWSDIAYQAVKDPTFPPNTHLQRIITMSVGYGNAKSPHYHDQGLLAAVTRGLQYWYANTPKSYNWWWNDIGAPLKLIKILTITSDDLPKPVLSRGLTFLKDPTQVDPQYRNAENFVWFSQEQLVRGVLSGNPQDIHAAIRNIQSEMAFSKGSTQEGLQPDYSFHMHGAQLYNGRYGIQYLHDILYYANIVAGTQFAFDQASIRELSDYLIDGTNWMTIGDRLNVAASGQTLTQKNKDADMREIARAATTLSKLDPPRKAIYDSLNMIANGTITHLSSLNGNKYFWTSDFMVQRNDYYYASVKMISSRTVGTEEGNGSNLKGGWLPYGQFYLTNDYHKDVWNGIFPAWDWLKIPGTTTAAEPIALKNATEWGEAGATAMGVSNSIDGAAAMRLSKGTLQGNKVFFFLPGAVAALGSGIRSSEGVDVVTTVTQNLLTTPVQSDMPPLNMQQGEHDGVSPAWVLQDSTGYFFPGDGGAKVNVKAETQTGDWKSIYTVYDATPVSVPVFTVWFDHGRDPQNASYACVIFPRADKAKMEAYKAAPYIRVVSNTPSLEAVTDDKARLTEAVVYAPSTVQAAPGVTVQANRPCLFLLDLNRMILTAGNPGGAADITLTVNRNGQSKAYQFRFTGDYAENPSQTKPL